jgi:hypothetical protein
MNGGCGTLSGFDCFSVVFGCAGTAAVERLTQGGQFHLSALPSLHSAILRVRYNLRCRERECHFSFASSFAFVEVSKAFRSETVRQIVSDEFNGNRAVITISEVLELATAFQIVDCP